MLLDAAGNRDWGLAIASWSDWDLSHSNKTVLVFVLIRLCREPIRGWLITTGLQHIQLDATWHR